MLTPPHRNRPIRAVNIASMRATFERGKNGSTYVRSTEKLGDYPARVTDRLEQWAQVAPDRIFLAERASDSKWRTINYSETLRRVRRLASGLLSRGLSEQHPLVILSENSIEHGLLALAAMYAGIPYAPIAPAYSLSVREFSALGHVWENLRPGMAFVQEGKRFTSALQAVECKDLVLVHFGSSPTGIESVPLDALEKDENSPQLADAHQKTDATSVAKILYTSGSTGMPKGVITTHGMLCANQQMILQVMRCLGDIPPILCDWLPWNHTFGGSHNFGIALHNGGTLYIDRGRPTPDLFQETVNNLREIAPTAYFNVPRGYEMLAAQLRKDASLRKTFFSRLQFLFFAAAGLSQRVWDEMQELAYETCGEEILVVTGLGATESAPFAISTGIDGSRSGWIGLPAPGVELKLVPTEGRVEARLRGPSITPGFWRRPDLNAAAFDEEHFYCMGDAIKLADFNDPQRGFIFDGRLNEDFKLSSGTWVRVGNLRTRLLAHFDGLLQDAVFAGPDRDYVVALLFPSAERCQALCVNSLASASTNALLARNEVMQAFRQRLNGFAAMNPGNSTCVARAIVLTAPPSMEAAEITDKGSINQSAVLKNRADLVDRLYQEPAQAEVICVQTECA